MIQIIQLRYGAKETIPNSTITLGELPLNIDDNEGIILFTDQITSNSKAIDMLQKLNSHGVRSNRILLISCLCSDKGLNRIAKEFPKQVIYTASVDKEDKSNNILQPGIGNPMLRLSTKFQEKN